MTGGYLLIEWIGHASIFANPVVEWNLAHNRYPPGTLRVLRLAARRRIYRPERGNVVRELRPDAPQGLSKTYRWGPDERQMQRLREGGRLSEQEINDAYVQQVRESDWRIIQAERSLAGEFMDVTELEPQGPAGLRKGLLAPPRGIELVRTEDLESVGALTRELPPERIR